MRSLTARELINALVRDGFSLRRQTGSHRRYQHPDRRTVTVAYHHSGDTFPIDTLMRMVRGAGWTVEDLERLGIY